MQWTRSSCVVHIGLASVLKAAGVLGCGGSALDSTATTSAPKAHAHRAVLTPEERTRRRVYGKRLRAYLSTHHGRPMQWMLARAPGERTIWIEQSAGFCSSPLSWDPANLPQVKGIRQETTRKRVVLTFFVIRAPFPQSGSCAGLETMLHASVHVRGGLRGRPIYDGSQVPPVKRWPGIGHG